MGTTADDVLQAFIRESDEWCGIYVLEALLFVTDAGPARRYRVQSRIASGRRTRIGVSHNEGWCLSPATQKEEAELEEGIRRGWVQITRMRRGHVAEVLHQADGALLQ